MGKLNPTRLAGIVSRLPKVESPDLIVGIETMDDAGVFRIAENLALVQTLDFFYPIVNDPRSFGRIVAANALSDVWAMGGEARTALNILAFPAGKIPEEAVEDLLAGGSEKLVEAGVVLVGGHTMEQEDFVYGMSVTGTIDPSRVLTNTAARAGDALILTKPLGTGVYSNTFAANHLADDHYRVFVESMERLNVYGARILEDYAPSAMTDVTGFGLLGHALPLARNAGRVLEIEAHLVPFLPEIDRYLGPHPAQGVCKTRQYVSKVTQIDDGVDSWRAIVMHEAQTSGGLLAAVAPDKADEAVARLREAGDRTAAVIGRVADAPPQGDPPIYLRILP